MTASRVLLLVPEFYGPPGGILRHLRLVARSLQETGANLTVVALHENRDRDKFDKVESLGIHYVSCGGNRAAFVWSAILAAGRLPVLIASSHPNFAPLALILARLTGARSVTFIHGIDVWSRLRVHRRLALRHVDQLISISGFTAHRAVQANGLDAGRIHVLYGCLDAASSVCEQRRRGDGDGRAMLLTVSRLAPHEKGKGNAVTLHALRRVLTHYPTATLTVVGDGDGRRPLEHLVHELGIGHAVSFLGEVSQAELYELYARSTIFVLPSRNEGFGFVFIEAMAHGLPVVGGNQDATAEIVADGQTGILVDPGDSQAVARALLELLKQPDRAAEMGRAGARLVRDAFQYDRFRQQLGSILADLICGAAT